MGVLMLELPPLVSGEAPPCVQAVAVYGERQVVWHETHDEDDACEHRVIAGVRSKNRSVCDDRLRWVKGLAW